MLVNHVANRNKLVTIGGMATKPNGPKGKAAKGKKPGRRPTKGKPRKGKTVESTQEVAKKTGGHQLPARASEDLYQAIKLCADGERRKIAPMTIILIEEALRVRGLWPATKSPTAET